MRKTTYILCWVYQSLNPLCFLFGTFSHLLQITWCSFKSMVSIQNVDWLHLLKTFNKLHWNFDFPEFMLSTIDCLPADKRIICTFDLMQNAIYCYTVLVACYNWPNMIFCIGFLIQVWANQSFFMLFYFVLLVIY